MFHAKSGVFWSNNETQVGERHHSAAFHSAAFNYAAFHTRSRCFRTLQNRDSSCLNHISQTSLPIHSKKKHVFGNKTYLSVATLPNSVFHSTARSHSTSTHCPPKNKWRTRRATIKPTDHPGPGRTRHRGIHCVCY